MTVDLILTDLAKSGSNILKMPKIYRQQPGMEDRQLHYTDVSIFYVFPAEFPAHEPCPEHRKQPDRPYPMSPRTSRRHFDRID